MGDVERKSCNSNPKKRRHNHHGCYSEPHGVTGHCRVEVRVRGGYEQHGRSEWSGTTYILLSAWLPPWSPPDRCGGDDGAASDVSACFSLPVAMTTACAYREWCDLLM